MDTEILNDVKIIEPHIFTDNRGWFFESYNKEKMKDFGIDVEFIQDNHSLSIPKNTIRGIHFQNNPYAQSKLIRCTKGRIMDYAIDLRKGSSTYLKWVGVELSEKNKKQIFIPKGFGHIFITLEDNCEVQYKVDNIYSKENERSIRYDDPEIGIPWPKDLTPILSEKDANAPLMKDSDCNFIV